MGGMHNPRTVHACATICLGGSHEIDSEGYCDFSQNVAPPKINQLHGIQMMTWPIPSESNYLQ